MYNSQRRRKQTQLSNCSRKINKNHFIDLQEEQKDKESICMSNQSFHQFCEQRQLHNINSIALKYKKFDNQKTVNDKNYAQQNNRQTSSKIYNYFDHHFRPSTPFCKKQAKAIKNSQIFNNKRKLTFTKFNYKTFDNHNISYGKVFDQIIKNKYKIKTINCNTKIANKGTLNVVDLWSQKNLRAVCGNFVNPLGRSNIIRAYSRKQFHKNDQKYS